MKCEKCKLHKDNYDKKWLLHLTKIQLEKVKELQIIEKKNRVQKLALFNRKKLLDELTLQLSCKHKFI